MTVFIGQKNTVRTGAFFLSYRLASPVVFFSKNLILGLCGLFLSKKAMILYRTESQHAKNIELYFFA
jgi:hypothetical protein